MRGEKLARVYYLIFPHYRSVENKILLVLQQIWVKKRRVNV